MTEPVYLWKLSGKTYKIFESAEEQPYRVKNKTLKRVHEEYMRNRQRIIEKSSILDRKNIKIRDK